MILDPRTDSNPIPNANWRIKISQIECSPNNKHMFSDGTTDEELLAPPGCLQYHRDVAGYYESFNYNGGQGPYLRNLAYSICFKRFYNLCGMRHTAVTFNLSANVVSSEDGSVKLLYGGRERDCDSNTYDLSFDEGHRFDYLNIPDAEFASPESSLAVTRASKFCGNSFKPGDSVDSFYTGPLHVSFRSDAKFYDKFPDLGFKMKYAIMDTNHKYGRCDVIGP